MPKDQSVLLLYFKSLSRYYSAALGLIAGILVFYFLYFLDAFGIQKGLSYSGHSHLFRSLSFGMLTWVFFSLAETFLQPFFTLSSYSKKALWYAVLIFLCSNLIFLLFNFFWNWQEWNLEAYLLIIKEFPLLMILPLFIYLLIGSLIEPKDAEVPIFLFQSENGKDQLTIKLNDFLFASAAENYITIFYQANEKVNQHLIRKPLKVLEKEFETYKEIERCHRSYLVNKHKVAAIKQTKGKVIIEIADQTIPVSKKYQELFLQ